MKMTIDEQLAELKGEAFVRGIKERYENRLKADLVAILTEIQLEIDEKATELCDDGWWLTYNDLIQQKINSLKENNDGSNNN